MKMRVCSPPAGAEFVFDNPIELGAVDVGGEALEFRDVNAADAFMR
jgi:hypothetical protein